MNIIIVVKGIFILKNNSFVVYFPKVTIFLVLLFLIAKIDKEYIS